jgi:Ycf66 protein N-terminus
MLNHLLAGIVALGSLVLFLSGFFFPEVQRKPDLAWSGVALLYALLLFAEGDRTSGGALLGHIASTALILWFGWQTLQQRRQYAALEEQTAIPNSLEALTPFLKEGWGRIAIAYGEASSWVKAQLGEDDPSIAPEALTQQSQDWDDPSTDSEPDDLAAAVAPEPTQLPTPPEVEPTPTAVATPESVQGESPAPLTTEEASDVQVESPASPTTEEASESLAASSEPEQASDEPALPSVSDRTSAIETKNVATAEQQESAPSASAPVEASLPEAEPASPVTEAEDTLPSEPPAASTQPEDDGSWPPPEPEV